LAYVAAMMPTKTLYERHAHETDQMFLEEDAPRLYITFFCHETLSRHEMVSEKG